IRTVVKHAHELIVQIANDQTDREKIENATPLSVFNRTEKTCVDLKTENSIFMWFELFIEILIRMKHTETSRKELVDICKINYEGNHIQLDIIEEFDRTYTPSKAIEWYTRACCIYKILNKALRIKDLDILFAFRFLITDIFTQLKQEQQRFLRDDPIIIVYRGQAISMMELNRMKSSIDGFIATNTIGGDLQPILFEIEANTRLETKPFANISHLSYFRQEEEVLFILGTIFRINNIVYSQKQNIWIAKLVLCTENDDELKTVFDYMKNEIVEETDLISLGNLLWEIGEFGKSEKYYHRLLNMELPTNDVNIPRCYDGLGSIAKDKGDYENAFIRHKTALDIRLKTLSHNHCDIGNSYNCMGEVYRKKGDYDNALEYYYKALKIWLNTLGNDHRRVSWCYNNIGNVYENKNQYEQALFNYNIDLKICQKILPSGHPDLACTYNSIGNIYSKKGEYDLSFDNYEKALKIQLKSLPSSHQLIAETYENIGALYELTNKLDLALLNYNKAAQIFHSSLPLTHPDVIQIENFLRRVNDKLK
ncbi:unnamed protein product, partial [Didymodactylos carnosus]